MLKNVRIKNEVEEFSVRRQIASCAICKSRTVFKCSRCKHVFYCGRNHQAEHWKYHRYECQPKVCQRSVNFMGPKDCFIDASKVNHTELITFISLSLSKVGLCVLDNYLNDDLATCVFLESRAICVGKGFDNFEERLATKFLTKEDTELYPAISNLQVSFNKLVNLASENMEESKLIDKGLYFQHISRAPKCLSRLENIFSENMLEKSLFDESIISCSYFSSRNYNTLDGGLSRYYLQNYKIVDLEPTFNRLIIFWTDGRILKKSSPSNIDLLIISSMYNIS